MMMLGRAFKWPNWEIALLTTYTPTTEWMTASPQREHEVGEDLGEQRFVDHTAGSAKPAQQPVTLRIVGSFRQLLQREDGRAGDEEDDAHIDDEIGDHELHAAALHIEFIVGEYICIGARRILPLAIERCNLCGKGIFTCFAGFRVIGVENSGHGFAILRKSIRHNQRASFHGYHAVLQWVLLNFQAGGAQLCTVDREGPPLLHIGL